MAWAILQTGTDFQNTTSINEVLGVLNKVLTIAGETTVSTVSAGDDIQQASFYSNIQQKIEDACTAFLKPAAATSTELNGESGTGNYTIDSFNGTGTKFTSLVTGLSSGWNKSTGTTYGQCAAGDYLFTNTFNIWDDICAALEKLYVTAETASPGDGLKTLGTDYDSDWQGGSETESLWDDAVTDYDADTATAVSGTMPLQVATLSLVDTSPIPATMLLEWVEAELKATLPLSAAADLDGVNYYLKAIEPGVDDTNNDTTLSIWGSTEITSDGNYKQVLADVPLTTSTFTAGVVESVSKFCTEKDWPASVPFSDPSYPVTGVTHGYKTAGLIIVKWDLVP